ncbi:unnamed protein product [Periconia digitata]|uniref:Uncharacterized protein n=1 Tax=Periconia digitata TaxID=1303443 RepID=A0A9W4XGB6_9PLEO|nr:unnamed protein product [Periconia digitata]
MPDYAGPNTGADPTIYNIYPYRIHHKRIQTDINLAQESSFSRTPRNTNRNYDDCPFYVHRPHLAFHRPPRVLYAGEDRKGKPKVLIHSSAFWCEYKLQYGNSLAASGAVDPRGLVKWRHDGGTRADRKRDDRKLKGYKVGNWHVPGDSGKNYDARVKMNRQNGTGQDPDVSIHTINPGLQGARAEGVVYLKWKSPLSLKTRQYDFNYAGVEFRWKGTKSVDKPGFRGVFVRYGHLKLEAQLPATMTGQEMSLPICLGKYTSSVTFKKFGHLELFDRAIWKLQDQINLSTMKLSDSELEEERGKNVKSSDLYQIIVATAMCMIESEKQKRAFAYKWLVLGDGEGADGSGGGGDGGE